MMNHLFARSVSWGKGLRVLLIVAILAALVMLTVPTVVMAAEMDSAEMAIAQVEDGYAEAPLTFPPDVGFCGMYQACTNYVSWNS